jgi:hypothetical protein
MDFFERHQMLIGTVFSVLLLLFFVLWAEIDAESLQSMVHTDDTPIETLSAVLFGLSSVGFVIFAWRSEFLKKRGGSVYLMTVCWALLMFIFMGEEISWGQRIFDLQTPDSLKAVNKQGEINIHNIEFVDSFMGGKFRYLSIMMITTGLILPVFAMTRIGRSLIQKLAFPVSPFCYAPLFVGAYLFGAYYFPYMGNDAAEVREFIMSVAMFCFAMHGALFPCTLFRVCSSSSNPSKIN